jgi:hypothetical protein
VDTRAVGEEPDDLSRVVDALGSCTGTGRAWHVDGGQGAASVEKAVFYRADAKTPTICPASLMPRAKVKVLAPGTSMVVKV